MRRYQGIEGIVLVEEENIGFAKANNQGYARRASGTDFVFFLNPDAFPAPRFIEQAVKFLQSSPKVAIVSGKLLWFDVAKNRETNLFDSSGIFRAWYGRWYDRGQGQPDRGQYERLEEVPAVCGAAMFCRCAALAASNPVSVFDPDFFLYKEDIELCLRLRQDGWSILYLPELIVHHGRGWACNRGDVPLKLRQTAAMSELLLYKKHPSPYMLWAIFKFLLVRMFHI